MRKTKTKPRKKVKFTTVASVDEAMLKAQPKVLKSWLKQDLKTRILFGPKIKERVLQPLASENATRNDWERMNIHDEEAKMKDSGTRQHFEGGATRDTAADKPRLDLISPFALERLGQWLRLGALKYSDDNWSKGMPFRRCIASAMRHIVAYMMRRTDEDHLAAAFCKLMFLLHYDSMSPEFKEKWDDRPKYITS